MAISNKTSNNIKPYEFEVNCNDCQYNDAKSGCIFNRCMFKELPEPKSLEVNTECILCKEVFKRPVYSIINIILV